MLAEVLIMKVKAAAAALRSCCAVAALRQARRDNCGIAMALWYRLSVKAIVIEHRLSVITAKQTQPHKTVDC